MKLLALWQLWYMYIAGKSRHWTGLGSRLDCLEVHGIDSGIARNSDMGVWGAIYQVCTR